MPEYVSKMTARHRFTIPEEIRSHLKITIGDYLAYEETADGRVILRKATPSQLNSPPSLLSEWNSEVDTQAYHNL